MAKMLSKAKYPPMQSVVVGYPKYGKTTLIASFVPPGKSIYVIPVDNRADEYVELMGENRVLTPDCAVDAPWKLREPRLILEEVQKDAEAGIFKNVALVVIDSVTPWYQQETRATLDAKLDGGKASYVGKANAMKLALAIAQYPGLPYFLIWHTEEAGDQHGKMSERESLSQLEVARMQLGINTEIETIRKTVSGKHVYGVKVKSRYRPSMKAVEIWDAEGNYFKGMFDKINSALYDTAPGPSEPTKWEDYGENTPFPPVEKGKLPTAVLLAVDHFVEYNGEKIYPFGDPRAITIKADGSEGTNGALNHAMHAYEKIKAGNKEGYEKPTTPGQFAKVWKQYVGDKITAQIKEIKAAQLVATAVELGGVVKE